MTSTSEPRKISEAFLTFAEPLLGTEPSSRSQQEVEEALKVAFVVWNAVVLDSVNGGATFLTQLRQQVFSQPPIAALVEQLILRKRTHFPDDSRLVGEYQIIEREGGWRLKVEARAATPSIRFDVGRKVR